ncbi:MAG TPA: UMP kinase [archaeon]|nr:UMP kinase [archaeon]
MKIVLKLGGSTLCPSEPNHEFAKKLAGLLTKKQWRHSFAIVCGGGRTARVYADALRKTGATEAQADMVGIEAARLNARMIISALGDAAYGHPVRDLDDLESALATGKIAVLGGFMPGQTTDAVAVETAEMMDADLIIIGKDVDYVYTDNPKTNPKARKLERLKHAELLEIVRNDDRRAGSSAIMDLVGAVFLRRSKIRTAFLRISDLKNFEALLEGKKFKGTIVE